MSYLSEDAIERWLVDAVMAPSGWTPVLGGDIGPGMPEEERASWSDVVLRGRLEAAVERLNPDIPEAGRAEAVKLLLRTQSQNLVEDNAAVHRMLIEGCNVPVYENGKQLFRAFASSTSTTRTRTTGRRFAS
jgi:type I restriction enzyme, R subunit